MHKPFGGRFLKRLRQEYPILLIVLPGLMFYLLFHYAPLYGILVAFKDFRITRGIMGSPWAGLKYFEQIFGTPDFWQVIRNTLSISVLKIVFSFPVPIVLAILLNEIRFKPFYRLTQSVMYLPYLISWTVIGGLVFEIFSGNGMINGIRGWMGLDRHLFLTDQGFFRSLVVMTDIWKNSGWSAIIYLATLTSINPELYEAAAIDGAGWLRRTWAITIPELMDVIIVLFIISIGSLLSAGFDQVYVLYNPGVYKTGDILDTFIFRMGIKNARFSYAAAAGVVKSVVSAIMLFSADRAAKRVAGRGIV